MTMRLMTMLITDNDAKEKADVLMKLIRIITDVAGKDNLNPRPCWLKILS